MFQQKPGVHPPESEGADRQVAEEPEQLGQFQPVAEITLAEPHRRLFLIEAGVGAVADRFEIHRFLLC